MALFKVEVTHNYARQASDGCSLVIEASSAAEAEAKAKQQIALSGYEADDDTEEYGDKIGEEDFWYEVSPISAAQLKEK